MGPLVDQDAKPIPDSRNSARVVPRLPDESQNVERDLALFVASERLIGDQGEKELSESRHASTIGTAVIGASAA